MKKSIICIVGRTASGKDKLTKEAVTICNNWIKEQDYEFELIISYTTRPRREDDTDESHIFITEEEYKEIYESKPKCAYTDIGGYRYFTTLEQISTMFRNNKIPVYIVDPKGVKYLKDTYKSVDVYTIYISAKLKDRRLRFVNRYTDSNIGYKEFKLRNFAEAHQFHVFEKEKAYNYLIYNDNCDVYLQNTRIMILASMISNLGCDYLPYIDISNDDDEKG